MASSQYSDQITNRASAPSSHFQMPLNPVSWAISPSGRSFTPSGQTVSAIPPGTYQIEAMNDRLWLSQIEVNTDEIISLPDSAYQKVLESIRRFWNQTEKYKDFGLLHKRGVLLWGPPGSGKTVCIDILSKELIQSNGIVLFTSIPEYSTTMLPKIREIEPDRPIINIMEDVDELLERFGQHDILSLLDGENQIGNVVHLATTNYPEKLGARIINRPSRFDEVIKVGMPTAESRKAYLNKFGIINLDKWTEDTEGMSIAHLRELTASVLCLEFDYQEVLERLKAMAFAPKTEDGFSRRKMGM